jgi:hypothetical protein
MAQVRASWTWIAVPTAAGAISWQAATLTLAALVVSGVLRLLTEWQRRQTIKVLMAGAREGAVLDLRDTAAGQSMKVNLTTVPSLQSKTRS